MKYILEDNYGCVSLKKDSEVINYKGFKDKLLLLNDKYKGYIRLVGNESIYEHGFSMKAEVYKFITLNYEVIDMPYNSTIEIIK